MIRLMLLGILSFNYTLVFSQRYDRGGEEYGGGGLNIGLIVLSIIVGIIIIHKSVSRDLKRREKVFKDNNINKDFIINFDTRFAIRNGVHLEYPIGYIDKRNILNIISMEEADKSGKIGNRFQLSINDINDLKITQSTDAIDDPNTTFNTSLTIFEKNGEIIEFVLNGRYESGIKKLNKKKVEVQRMISQHKLFS